MKLTWFGGTAVRVHAGGSILVIDPQTAAAPVRLTEMASGADLVLRSDDPDLPVLDQERWRPQRRGRLLDAAGSPPVELFRWGKNSILIAAAAEPQLGLLAPNDTVPDGRWAEDAVLVMFGLPFVWIEGGLLERLRPRLLALAMPDEKLDAALDALRPHLAEGDIGLVTLEPEMAVEL